MASVEIEKQRIELAKEENCSAKAKQGEGLKQYYQQHIHDLQLHVRQRSHNLNRLEAQRNDLNSKGTAFSHSFLSFYCFSPIFIKPNPKISIIIEFVFN